MAIVIIAFAILLIAIKRARSAENSETVRLGSWALAGVCGAFVADAIAIGVIAMVNKPSSAKPGPRTAPAQ
jgi:hypothetical protein